VSIITKEEIKKYGYRNLADMLRGVQGLFVNYDVPTIIWEPEGLLEEEITTRVSSCSSMVTGSMRPSMIRQRSGMSFLWISTSLIGWRSFEALDLLFMGRMPFWNYQRDYKKRGEFKDLRPQERQAVFPPTKGVSVTAISSRRVRGFGFGKSL